MQISRDDTASIKIRMSMDLRLELGKIAKQNGVTLNSLINMVLKEYTSKDNARKK
jgi:antitoxin component of RelBE/YafQ-DinJ toxin-antitoxin module